MAGMTPLAPAVARADSSSNPPVDELETISRKLDAILQELANEKKSTVNEEQLIDESSRGESRDVKKIKETEGIMTEGGTMQSDLKGVDDDSSSDGDSSSSSDDDSVSSSEASSLIKE
jgi:hypothetical protein